MAAHVELVGTLVDDIRPPLWTFHCDVCGLTLPPIPRSTGHHMCPGAKPLPRKPRPAAKQPEAPPLLQPCQHRGEPTGEIVTKCGCHVPNSWKVIYVCAVHTECVPRPLRKGKGKLYKPCNNCPDRLAPQPRISDENPQADL